MKSLKNILTFFALVLIFSCNIEPFEGEVIGESEEENTIPSADTCEEAITNTANAALAYTTLSSSESCTAYKIALQNQIDICGDTQDALQTIINSLGECGDESDPSEVNIHAFMTANINGEQYNDMKPNSYLFFPGGVSVNGFFTRGDDDYLVMQGNSGYRNPTSILETDREINLKIPSVNWKEGTFVLYDDYNDIFEGVCHYTFFGLNRPSAIYTRELAGEIVISKFSLEERVIQGTFEFQYFLVSEIDHSEEGPYKVTGTFDYSLDDEFFD